MIQVFQLLASSPFGFKLRLERRKCALPLLRSLLRGASGSFALSLGLLLCRNPSFKLTLARLLHACATVCRRGIQSHTGK